MLGVFELFGGYGVVIDFDDWGVFLMVKEVVYIGCELVGYVGY